MLGAIVSGRLVQTGKRTFDWIHRNVFQSYFLDFQVIEENKFLLNIPEADNLNYIVIFLTGSTPLPFGTAAGRFRVVFIQERVVINFDP